MKINSTQFEVRGRVIYFPLVGGRKGTGAPQCWEKDGMTQFEGGGRCSLFTFVEKVRRVPRSLREKARCPSVWELKRNGLLSAWNEQGPAWALEFLETWGDSAVHYGF